MKISIALATYNGAKYLHQQLNSFVEQTRQPDELVVCDDCSTDTTLDILNDFIQMAPFVVRVQINTTNIGHTRNFEQALSLSSGDLIFLSDQDDVWDIKKISIISDCFINNSEIDVVINDAYYTDEKLNHSGVTVLQKVLSVGANGNGHIAGACTAIRKKFRDFILPFLQINCPQHDVYIHRWANLANIKLVIDKPLQIWRIHDFNTTLNNEMNQFEIVSPFISYTQTRKIKVDDAYTKKANEYKEMIKKLDEKDKYLSYLPIAKDLNAVRRKINNIIDANLNRTTLVKSGWFMRKIVIFRMILSGHYQHFKGIRSILKDLLR